MASFYRRRRSAITLGVGVVKPDHVNSWGVPPLGGLTRPYPRVTPELLLLIVALGCYHKGLRKVHIYGKRRIGEPITTRAWNCRERRLLAGQVEGLAK